jgi:hypothetical protein
MIILLLYPVACVLGTLIGMALVQCYESWEAHKASKAEKRFAMVIPKVDARAEFEAAAARVRRAKVFVPKGV